MDNLIYRVNFKKIALTNKITVKDATDNTVSYSHQKLLKLKEKVKLYSDESKDQQIAEINADSVIDYNVQYTLSDNDNNPVYKLKRQGRKSIWKANYEITDANDKLIARINEKNPWAKVMDTLFGAIPLVGLFAGYVFQAEYIMSDADGNPMYGIKKKPALLESSYEIYQLNDQDMPISLIHITLMALMRERYRS